VLAYSGEFVGPPAMSHLVDLILASVFPTLSHALAISEWKNSKCKNCRHTVDAVALFLISLLMLHSTIQVPDSKFKSFLFL
jgi:hypothetical protein